MTRYPSITLFHRYSKQSKRLIVPLLCSALLATASFAQADTQMIFQDSAGDKQRQLVMQIKAGKIRMGSPDSMIYTLYDSKDPAIYNINVEKKQYIKNTAALTKERGQKMRAMHKQMLEQQKAQLDQVPQEHRPMAEQRITMALQALENPPPPPAGKVTQKTTGKTETIQNINCEVIQLTFDDKPFREICLAKQPKMNADDFATLKQMFTFQYTLAKEAQPAGANPASEAMNEMDGLAVRVQDLPQGMKRELSQIQEIALDEKLFALDTSFQLIEPTDPPKRQTPATP